MSRSVPSTIVNAMTIDVEDYFHVSAFEGSIQRASWDSLESRVVRNTDRLLELLQRANVLATFFVLGWVAERHPALVKRIASAGHELDRMASAIDGANQSPQEFREDLRKSRAVISNAANVPIHGYRAPSFSITSRSLWALDIIREEGFTYDASIFPSVTTVTVCPRRRGISMRCNKPPEHCGSVRARRFA